MSQHPDDDDKDVDLGLRGRTSSSSSGSSLQKPLYQDNNKATIEFKGWRLGAVLFCIFFGVFLATMESSITATILVTVSEHFGDFDKSPWIVLAYLLTYMGFAMIFARISDVFGRKWCIIAAHSIFLTFNLACGLSQSMLQLIIFRACAGVGGAGLYALNMAAFPEVIPFKMMGLGSAGLGATLGGAGVLGPILGGVISKVNWRWCFLLNVPSCGLAIVLLLLSWQAERPGKGKSIMKQLGTIDWLGAVLLLSGSCLLTFGLQEAARNAYSWTSVIILASLTISGVSWGAFILWQHWLSRRRSSGLISIFPVRSFRHRIMFAVLLITFLNGVVFYTAVVYLPERFQIVNLKSPIGSGVCLLPLLGVAGFGAFFAGMANQKRNNTFLSLMVCIPALGGGVGLISTVGSSKSLPWHLYAFEAVLGVGFGPVMTVLTMMSNAYAEYEDLGAVQGAIAQTRIIGGSIGLSLCNVILNDKIKHELSGPLTATQINTVENLPLASKRFSAAQAELVRATYADGFQETFRVLAYISIACFAAAVLTFQRHPPPLGVKGKKKDQNQTRSSMIVVDEETGAHYHHHRRRSAAARPPSFYPLTLPEDFDMPFGLSEDFYRHISVYFRDNDGVGGPYHRLGGGGGAANNRRSRLFSRWIGDGWERRVRQKLPRGKTV